MNLISVRDLADDDLYALSDSSVVSLAALRSPPPAALRGTIALLFQQPSLRTMSSFAAAGVRLGLAPISITTRDPADFGDEIRQLALTSQCVAVRSNGPLSPADYLGSPVPIINAGDGYNEHPTQALIDLTVMRHFGLEGRTVVIMGNLRDHRTTHSLVLALQRFDVRVRLLSPRSLSMDPSYLGAEIEVAHAEDTRERDEAVADADYIYLIPMVVPSLSPLLTEAYSFDLAVAQRVLKPTAKIVHPFPRYGELHPSVDFTSFDAYHLQTRMAVPVRERVLRHLLHRAEERISATEPEGSGRTGDATDERNLATIGPEESLASNGCQVVRVVGERPAQICDSLRTLSKGPYVEAVDCQ